MECVVEIRRDKYDKGFAYTYNGYQWNGVRIYSKNDIAKFIKVLKELESTWEDEVQP